MVGKNIEVAADHRRKLAEIRIGGSVDIPIAFPAVRPDVWFDTLTEIGVVDRLIAPYIPKAEYKGIYLAVQSVQDGNLQGFVVVGMTHCDKQEFGPVIAAEIKIAGATGEHRVFHPCALASQSAEFLFKEIDKIASSTCQVQTLSPPLPYPVRISPSTLSPHLEADP